MVVAYIVTLSRPALACVFLQSADFCHSQISPREQARDVIPANELCLLPERAGNGRGTHPKTLFLMRKLKANERLEKQL